MGDGRRLGQPLREECPRCAGNPATFAAWKHLQISGDEAELMFRAAERMPDRYPGAESVLLELVGEGLDETRRVLDYWRNDIDLPGVRLDVEEQLSRRSFESTRRQNGMIEAGSLFRWSMVRHYSPPPMP